MAGNIWEETLEDWLLYELPEDKDTEKLSVPLTNKLTPPSPTYNQPELSKPKATKPTWFRIDYEDTNDTWGSVIIKVTGDS